MSTFANTTVTVTFVTFMTVTTVTITTVTATVTTLYCHQAGGDLHHPPTVLRVRPAGYRGAGEGMEQCCRAVHKIDARWRF